MKDKDFHILQKTNVVFLLIKTLEDIFKLNFILKNNLPAWRIIQIGVLVIFSFLKILIMWFSPKNSLLFLDQYYVGKS